ncbi:MAG: hypothetical protein ACOYIB_03570 [Desulfosporosinus sp.]
MYTYISIIFKIMDGFRKKPLLAPEIGIYLDGRRKKPLYKPGGYFIFTDLPSGQACFEFTAPIFRTEKVVADIPEAGKGYIMHHLMMYPSRKYPFGRPVTSVSGRITKGGEPFAEQQFYMIPGDGREVMRIAEDNAEAGNCSLKLFAVVPERQLSIPGNYMIKDKEEAKREFCLITQNAGKDGMYPLEKGMAYSHQRATPLVEVIGCATLSDSSFFAALPDLKKGQATLELLVWEAVGNSIRKTFEIEAYRENDLDVIKI